MKRITILGSLIRRPAQGIHLKGNIGCCRRTHTQNTDTEALSLPQFHEICDETLEAIVDKMYDLGLDESNEIELSVSMRKQISNS